MSNSSHASRIRVAYCCALVGLAFSLGVGATAPKQVLILHSFGRDFAPYDMITSVFRTELARQADAPITFVDANLDFRRTGGDKGESVFLAYLRARFDGTTPDVVVTIGPPAARFYLRHRAALFPETPMVMGALDTRFVQQVQLRPSDAVVAGKVDLPGLVENILTLLPSTQTIAVVVGASELERFWLGELQRELRPFMNRVRFEWLNDLSLEQMKDRVARLPPNSAVLYGLLIVDAAGVPHERQDALSQLHAVASAPMFGLYESELGKGVVGGPYSSQRARGERIAEAALRALAGTTASAPQVNTMGFERPVYDGRELDRWRIDRQRLPPDSEIRFEPPSLWQTHRTEVIATMMIFMLLASLLGALLAQRSRRRRAEREVEGLAGRVVTAHEDERRRLARELHDNVTQRLAGLSIEVSNLVSGATNGESGGMANAIRRGLAELSEDVHALSYRLHPSVIEDLGLVEALRIECDRVTHQAVLRVSFDCDGVPRKLPPDAALCLFRVAQEALRNIVRHARASNVDVSISGKNRGIALAVHDDGAGFDTVREGKRASLGLASMRERVLLLGGRLVIESKPGHGTALFAWVPLKEAA